MEPKKKNAVNKIVHLYNWRDKDFTHTYGGTPLSFPKHVSTPIQEGDQKTNEGIRDLMAYHLAIEECNATGYVPASKVDPKLVKLISKAIVPLQNDVIPQAEKSPAQESAPETIQLNSVPSGDDEGEFLE